MPKNTPIVSTSPDIMGGTPVFADTRVPIQTLFDYLKEGESIDDFLDGFPTVTREHVIVIDRILSAYNFFDLVATSSTV